MKRWLVRQLVKWMAPKLRFIHHNPELWRYVESKGYHVTPVHFYQPIPDTRELDELYRARTEAPGIDWQEQQQLRLVNEAFPPYAAEYTAFHEGLRAAGRLAERRLEFIGYDPVAYHCMIRHFKPARIIEVGAGYSTLIAFNAAAQNGATEITAIEPYPGDMLSGIASEIHLVKQIAQRVDIGVFSELQANDILFIDSSHIVKTGSDVCYLVLEALPRLAEGVIVHFHDIFLPFDYPMTWLKQRRVFWNEQYLIHAYLLHNQRARILFANRYMIENHPEALRRAFPDSPTTSGGSLWLRV
ncbi:MAG: class I SAM-dependent methyltransferase [Chloroflexota bacterium]|nr:class I SAM-dependent methyltransferase [Chloroflexota bacterium]MDE2908802.1 class I SAM-dependent methyltransferase [Chloroflexota bacterium]